MGIAGGPGKIATFLLDADTPALLCKGAPKSSGEQLEFSQDILRLGGNGMGHCDLNASPVEDKGRAPAWQELTQRFSRFSRGREG